MYFNEFVYLYEYFIYLWYTPVCSGILPRSWCRYTVPVSMTVIQWVSDFSERIKQLQQISQAAASGGAKELKVLFVHTFKQALVLK